MKSSEKNIQIALYQYFRGRGGVVFCDNIFLYKWESDFISLNSSGSLYECEIKKSKSDFLRDFKKRSKHSLLRKALSNARSGWKTDIRGVPTYFYYVCERGLIESSEVPEYSGLIYYTLSGNRIDNIYVVKKAKRLTNKSQSNTSILKKIASSLSHRKFSKKWS